MEQVRALPRVLSAPRAIRSRRAPAPLPLAVAERVNSSFYAPVLSGTHLAESLLRAAGTDAGQMASPEWRATLQQAMNQIETGCATWHDITCSEAAQEAFPRILATVDELERFLRLITPVLGDCESGGQRRQLELSSRALAQASNALEQIRRTILNPPARKPAAHKRTGASTLHRQSKASEKGFYRPGGLNTLAPGRDREPIDLAPIPPSPTAPLPTLPSAALDSPPAPALSAPLEPPGRCMTDGLKLLCNSGQWIEQAIRRDDQVKSENTQRDYIADLYVFNAWRRERPFTRALIEEYTATLERTGYSADAVEHALQALRWLASRLVELAIEDHQLDAEEQQDILISAAQVIGFRQARQAVPAQDPNNAKAELAALLYHAAQDPSWLGSRDAAIVALAWSAGLKPSQLASLKVTSIQCDSGAVSLIIRRGIKDETLPLPDLVTQAVLKWLSIRRYNTGPLFYAASQQGSIRWGHALSQDAVVDVIKARMIAAQIASAPPQHH